MIGNIDGQFDPKEIRVSGTKLAIRKNETNEDVVLNGVAVPNSAINGYKGVTGTIVACGEEATETYGVVAGHTVAFDQCGVFHDTTPIVILNSENLIARIDEDGESIPMKNQVYVRKIGTFLEMNSDIEIPDRHMDAAIGEVFKADTEDVVKIGERIIMTTGCDIVKTKDGEYSIYNQNDIIGIVDD